jgi:hypothetical protein
MLALPYTLFSFYYQWRVVKQWCVLCLAVQSLLLLGAASAFTNQLGLPLSALSIGFIIKALLVFMLPALSWYSIKPYLLKLQQAKTTKREYLRIKFNTEIFETLLKKQKTISVPVDGLGIDLGNPAATNTLIKVCSLYCGHCSKDIEKLKSCYTNIKT